MHPGRIFAIIARKCKWSSLITWALFNKHHKACENIYKFALVSAKNLIEVIKGCVQRSRAFFPILGQAAYPVGYHLGSEQASISGKHLPHYTMLNRIEYCASCQGWTCESPCNQGTSYACNGEFAMSQTYTILPSFTKGVCAGMNKGTKRKVKRTKVEY